MFEIQQPICEKPMAFTRNDKEKYKIFDFLFFGAEKYTQLVGSQFPDQGSHAGPASGCAWP